MPPKRWQNFVKRVDKPDFLLQLEVKIDVRIIVMPLKRCPIYEGEVNTEGDDDIESTEGRGNEDVDSGNEGSVGVLKRIGHKRGKDKGKDDSKKVQKL